VKKKLHKSILAEGEITGHHHKLIKEIDVLENEDGSREFSLKEPTDLVHEEHKKITLPTGYFESDRVQEYDHFTEEARRVQD